MLTRKQHELLVYIDHHLKATGFSPSFEEMKSALKLKSKAGIHRLIAALEERGFISRLHGRVRALNVLRLPEMIAARTAEPTAREAWCNIAATGIRSEPALFASGERAADDLLEPELPQFGHIAADLPMGVPRGARERMTTPGPHRLDNLPSPQALQIATEAVCRGYDLAEIMRHPEIVHQVTELARLLVADGLVPTEPELAAVRSDTTGHTARKLPQEPHTAEIVDQVRHAGQRILVVDDVTDVLVNVRAFLVNAGFAVVTATDGDAALRLVASDPLIGILITDFAMPGLSGVDLIAQAVQYRPNVKALLISGYPNADGLADLPSHIKVLTKPFRRAALIAQVKTLVSEALPMLPDKVMGVVQDLPG